MSKQHDRQTDRQLFSFIYIDLFGLWLVLLIITTTWLLGDTTFLQPKGSGHECTVLGLLSNVTARRLETVEIETEKLKLFKTCEMTSLQRPPL